MNHFIIASTKTIKYKETDKKRYFQSKNSLNIALNYISYNNFYTLTKIKVDIAINRVIKAIKSSLLNMK